MSTDRRDFLGTLLAGGLAPMALNSRAGEARPLTPRQGSKWDVTWADRIKGTHRAVFDSPEISEGLALLRTLVWFNQYKEVYSTPASDMSAVVVLRHNAIWMIMNNEFWDHHNVGAITKINDPATGQPIKRNPFLGATPFADLPPDVTENILTKVLGTATVLACNLAFQDVVENIKNTEKVDDTRARNMAVAHVVPGIILQPSGVFAALRAQEAGCHYFIAS